MQLKRSRHRKNPRQKISPRKNLSPRVNPRKKGPKGKNKKRRPESEDTDEDKKFCVYCKGNGGRHWTHNADDCYFIKNLGNKGSNKKPKYQNKNSKEFNALVKAQVQKILKQKNKNSKKDQSSSESETNSSGEE